MSRIDDLEEIRALIQEYAHRLDAGDLDGVAERLFRVGLVGDLSDHMRTAREGGA